jgi:hypothetical protein
MRGGAALPETNGDEDMLLLAVEERTRPATARSSRATRTAAGLGLGGGRRLLRRGRKSC